MWCQLVSEADHSLPFQGGRQTTHKNDGGERMAKIIQSDVAVKDINEMGRKDRLVKYFPVSSQYLHLMPRLVKT